MINAVACVDANTKINVLLSKHAVFFKAKELLLIFN